MIRRLGHVLFVLGLALAVIFAAMGAIMLINGVPGAAGGATALFVGAAVSAGVGAAVRFVCGWR